jgi:hypothetical protein
MGRCSRRLSVGSEYLYVSAGRRVGWGEPGLRYAEHPGGDRGDGSLMRHARAAPGTVSALPVVVVQAAFGAALVAPAGCPETPGPARLAARPTAVRAAPIAGPVEEERPLTPAAGADTQEVHNWSG